MGSLTPKEITAKHAKRLRESAEEIRTGVNRVTESPTEKAALKVDKMRAKIIESIDNGKWARRLRDVSLEQWKKAMLDKGIGRIPAGIESAAPKVEAFYAELMPHIASVKKDLEGMADITIEDSILRMATFIRGMAKFERGGGV
tara:strand:- start:465 stop:896 length:432 start_codon:yes stop_codon:yes gene_type:complete